VGKIRERKKESEGEDRRMGEMDGSGALAVTGATEGMERGTWRQGRPTQQPGGTSALMLSGANGQGGAERRQTRRMRARARRPHLSSPPLDDWAGVHGPLPKLV
jgi:hypothetical protein